MTGFANYSQVALEDQSSNLIPTLDGLGIEDATARAHYRNILALPSDCSSRAVSIVANTIGRELSTSLMNANCSSIEQ